MECKKKIPTCGNSDSVDNKIFQSTHNSRIKKIYRKYGPLCGGAISN